MTCNSAEIARLKEFYASRRSEIRNRLRGFEKLWGENDERVFAELCFCLCTPQTKARNAWTAISGLMESGILFHGKAGDIESRLVGVRFSGSKARYIAEAREYFMREGKIRIKEKIKKCSAGVLGNPSTILREWLVNEILGLGYKEASHFLRNIGLGRDLAILDRHILKNLRLYGVIKEAPETLSKRKYLEIESLMRKFSQKINIPMDELDLLLWCKETGEVFK